MAKKKSKESKPKRPKTLHQIKRGVEEAETDKEEVILIAENFKHKEDEKSKSMIVPFLIGTIVCVGVMGLGLLERSKVIMTIGGVGFLSFLVMVLYQWTIYE